MAIVALSVSSYFAGRQRGFQLGHRHGVAETTLEWQANTERLRQQYRDWEASLEADHQEQFVEMSLLKHQVLKQRFEIQQLKRK